MVENLCLTNSILSGVAVAPPDNSYGTLMHEWPPTPPFFGLCPLSPMSFEFHLSFPHSVHRKRLKRPRRRALQSISRGKQGSLFVPLVSRMCRNWVPVRLYVFFMSTRPALPRKPGQLPRLPRPPLLSTRPALPRKLGLLPWPALCEWSTRLARLALPRKLGQPPLLLRPALCEWSTRLALPRKLGQPMPPPPSVAEPGSSRWCQYDFTWRLTESSTVPGFKGLQP